MKLLLITIVLAAGCGCLADKVAISDIKLDTETQNQLARAAIQVFIQSYGEELVSLLQTPTDTVDGAETRATLFPPLPDNIPLEDFVGTIPEDLGDLLVGTYNFTDVLLKGANNIEHFFQLIVLPVPTVKFNLNTGTITLTGTHDTDLSVPAGVLTINGEGRFELNIIDALVDLEVKVFYNAVTDRVRITAFNLELAIEKIDADFGDTNINDEPVNWAEFSTDVTQLLKENLGVIRDTVTDFVLNEGNELLAGCPVSELAALNFTCILNPSTSTPEPTTTLTPEGASTPADSSASRFAHIAGVIMLLPVMYLFA